MQAALHGMPDDTNRVMLLNALCLEYANADPDSGLHYGQQAMSLAKRLKAPLHEATAHRRIALNYFLLANYPKAIEHGQSALRLFEEIRFHQGIWQANLLLGRIYTNLENDLTARQHFTAARSAAEAEDNRSNIAEAWLFLGQLSGAENKYAEALDDLDHARTLYKELSMSENLAYVDAAEALIHMDQGSPEKALPLLFSSLKVATDANHLFNRGTLSYTIGEAYVTLASDTTNKRAPDSDLMLQLSDKTELLREAEKYIRMSIDLRQQLGDRYSLIDCFKLLSTIKENLGSPSDALAYYRMAGELQDSLDSAENRKRIDALTRQHEREVQEKKIQLQELEIERARQERWLILLGSGSLLFIAILAVYFLLKVRREKNRSDDLLHNILPAHTAKELKQHGYARSRNFDNVTVLFTDFKDFSKVSGQLNAEVTVSLINHYFTEFDRIIERYGLEKIKTIGDAYMAASGVPVRSEDHAAKAVDAAIAIRDLVAREMAERRANEEPFFEIRIGIHSGPVVAGIVGLKKFAYDIWGDTVNIAARMEQNGIPGKVNISASTYELIKDRFMVERRGLIKLKHGEELEMYFAERIVHELVTA